MSLPKPFDLCSLPLLITLCSFKFCSLKEEKSETNDETSEGFLRGCVLVFSVENFCGLFVLSLHESFMENKVHSAKSNSSQQFSADTLWDTRKNPG